MSFEQPSKSTCAKVSSQGLLGMTKGEQTNVLETRIKICTVELVWYGIVGNGVARILVWGGGHPADATRYFFRHLRKPTRFSGGGGGGG